VAQTCLLNCSEFNRFGCPLRAGDCCETCLPGFTGDMMGNDPCEALSPCQPATTCKNHGFCRSDESCGCYPDWYGADCSSPINAGSYSDVQLGGVIIAWLIAAPLLIVLTFCCLKQMEEGSFDKVSLKTLCPCLHRTHKPRQPKANRGRPEREENELAAVDSSPSSPVAIHRSPDVTVTPRQETIPDDAAARRSSAAGLLDPENADELVSQVLEILPNCTRQTARQALRDNQWNVSSTLPTLMN